MYFRNGKQMWEEVLGERVGQMGDGDGEGKRDECNICGRG
jgi:hypothetical protein